MCGRYSDGGSLKCGMNLCCSYYGKHVLQLALICIQVSGTNAEYGIIQAGVV